MKYALPIIVVMLSLLISCNNRGEEDKVSDYVVNLKDIPKPIIMIDYNVNAWSTSTLLYTSDLQHSDGRGIPLTGIIDVDGEQYRFMGSGKLPDKTIATMAVDGVWEGRYTFTKPSSGWEEINYDETDWSLGDAPYGNTDNINTSWPTPFLWVRRTIQIDKENYTNRNLYLKYSHDDELQIYINGIKIVQTGYEWGTNLEMDIPEDILKTFSNGEIVIAAHCQNMVGESLLDFGIYERQEQNKIGGFNAKYTFEEPAEGWQSLYYDDAVWNEGSMPFGTSIDYKVNTQWGSEDIWVRKELELTEDQFEKDIFLEYSYDDILTLFVNGIEVLKTSYNFEMNKIIEISDEAKEYCQDGKIIIAAHCKNRMGGALLDFSIYTDNVAKQKNIELTSTQTKYIFNCGEIELDVTFASPFLQDNIEVLSRPINYISYSIKSIDGADHDVSIYFDIPNNWNSDNIDKLYMSRIYNQDDFMFAKMGLSDQKVFEIDGESKKNIEWGYLFFASKEHEDKRMYLSDPYSMRSSIRENDCFASSLDSINRTYISFAHSFNNIKAASDVILLGYDEVYSIQYLGHNMRPYWNRKGNKSIEDVILEAHRDYKSVIKDCNSLDEILKNDKRLSLNEYRKLNIANKLVGGKGAELLVFNKYGLEGIKNNFLFLYNPNFNISPVLEPYFMFCRSNIWTRDYLPLNLGDFPLQNGPIDINNSFVNEEVEQIADIMFLLLKYIDNQHNISYLLEEWTIICKWNNYLNIYLHNRMMEDVTKAYPQSGDRIYLKAKQGALAFERIYEKVKRKTQ